MANFSCGQSACGTTVSDSPSRELVAGEARTPEILRFSRRLCGCYRTELLTVALARLFPGMSLNWRTLEQKAADNDQQGRGADHFVSDEEPHLCNRNEMIGAASLLIIIGGF